MNENGKLVKHGEAMQDYITDFDARRAARIIRDHAESPQHSKKPLYLQVDFVAPHSGAPVELDDPPRMATPAPAPRHRDRFVFIPLPTPPNYNEGDVKDKPLGVRRRDPIGDYVQFATTEDYQQRLESLLAVDGAVAAIVRALDRVGELENTYIFFTTDNGFFQGEHRIPSGKVLPYEESIHLPLLVRGPGIAPGTVLPQLVGNIDLAPTIAQMARVKPGVIVDGVSLLGLLKRRTWTETRDSIVLEAGPFDKPSQEYTGLRTSRYMFAVYGNGEEELYDLQVDPYELENRSFDPAYTAVRAELTDRLQRLRFCAAAPVGRSRAHAHRHVGPRGRHGHPQRGARAPLGHRHRRAQPVRGDEARASGPPWHPGSRQRARRRAGRSRSRTRASRRRAAPGGRPRCGGTPPASASSRAAASSASARASTSRATWKKAR